MSLITNRNLHKYFFVVILMLTFSLGNALAAGKLISTVDTTEISLDEELTMSVAVSDPNVKGLNFPQRTLDYEVVATSTSSSFQIINGVSSSNKTISFVIRALHLGNITLPPVSMTDESGVTHSTEPITINVSAPRANSAPRPQPGQPFTNSAAMPNPRVTQNTNNQVFARLELDNQSPYVNQQVGAKLKIYHRGNLRSVKINPPKLDKFIQRKNEKNKEYSEIYKGIEYLVYEVSYAIFPVKSGLVTIPKAEFEGLILQEQPFNPRGGFDPFRMMGQMLTEKIVTITVPSVTLNVKELPPGAPKEFSGYVGNLDLVDSIKPNQVKTGEAATLTTKISGDGNFRNLDLNRIESLKIFNVYKDKEKISEHFSGSWLSFSGEVNHALIPTKAKGKIKIKLKPVVIFNPRTGQYEEKGNSVFELDISYDPSVKIEEQAADSKSKEESKKSILEFSQKQIKNYQNQSSFDENWLMLLVIAIHLVYLVFLLVSKLKNINYKQESSEYNKEFKSMVKEIKLANEIASISKVVKDILLGNEAHIQDSNLKNQIQEFLSETDLLNYSGNISSSQEKIEELKNKALNLIKALSKELRRKQSA